MARKPAEEQPVEQPIDEELPLSKTVTVKNISGRTIHLAGGGLEPGKTGLATRAELSYLYNFIERVD
jgi:hypothetical protein